MSEDVSEFRKGLCEIKGALYEVRQVYEFREVIEVRGCL